MSRTLLLGFIAVLCAAPAVTGQFVYTLNSQGKLYVNAQLIEDGKGGVKLNDLDTDDLDDIDEIWNALSVAGSDWELLRFDGRLNENGEKTDDYSDEDEDGFLTVWWDMTEHQGQRWALRGDGRINVDGTVLVNFEDGDFFFRKIISDGTNAWSLRTDGRTFRDAQTPALFRFNGPDGVGDDDDGDAVDTLWIGLASDPDDGALYGLRRDGRIGRADPSKLSGDGGPPSVPNVATLPFPDDVDDVDLGKLYTDLAFLDDGRWIALRGSGQIYVEDGGGWTELVDLPGDPEDLDDKLFVALLPLDDGGWVTLRQDGFVYRDDNPVEVVDLPGNSFREIALSLEFPNLGNAKPVKPAVTGFNITGVVGQGFVMPVTIADPDTLPEDLVITVDEETIPVGAVWDGKTATLTWDDPGPKGSYKFKLEVSGGSDKPVKQTFTIKLKDPDDNPDKNLKPTSAKVKKATALDGIEYVLPILAFDRDGDELTVTPEDVAVFPYTAGAIFDPETDTFSWTPALADVGKVKLVFLVDDGTKVVKRKVTLKILSTLLTFP